LGTNYSNKERKVKLRLTAADNPGFGDAIDNTDSKTHNIETEMPH